MRIRLRRVRSRCLHGNPNPKRMFLLLVSYYKPHFIFVVGNLSRLKTMITSQLLIPLLVSKFAATRQSASNTSRINLNAEKWNLITSSASNVACLLILAVNRLTRSVLGRSTERDVIRNHRKPYSKFYIFKYSCQELTADLIEHLP